MSRELAFVLINPYPIRKSRTGGIIARYLVRTDLKLVGARLIGPSKELVAEFSDFLRTKLLDSDTETCNLLADYVERCYSPDPNTGRPHRCIMLLFEGEAAIQKIYDITGAIRQQWCCGQTVRDTYGDCVRNPETGAISYFEPAVLVASSAENVQGILGIFMKYLEDVAGIVRGARDVPAGGTVQQTLVLLKPDNWRQPSLRAGNIMDLLSIAGLRIVGVKKFAMSVAQAEKFYGPVRESLKAIFPRFGKDRAAQALSREFGFAVEPELLEPLCELLGPKFAEVEFENIVEFMTGRRPSTCTEEEKNSCGLNECLALVYEGSDAVNKIRDVLGSTDPSKARPGSIRREFGTNIMVNAAHASDSVENARREMRIIDIESDKPFTAIIRKYYPT